MDAQSYNTTGGNVETKGKGKKKHGYKKQTYQCTAPRDRLEVDAQKRKNKIYNVRSAEAMQMAL